MPATYKVFNDGKLIVERWSGRVTHEEMVRHLIRRVHDYAIEPGAVVLADGRQATSFETSEEAASWVADTHSTPDSRMKEARVAMVVRSDVLVRANLFAQRAAEHGVRVMVFEHFDVACTWLGLTPVEAEQRLLELVEPDDARDRGASSA